MSRQNRDTVRAAFEAFNGRDFDALFELYDPEIVWEQDEGFVEPGTHYGHAGMRRVFDSIFEGFDDFRIDVEQLIDVDDECVLAIVRIAGKGKLSGLELDNPGGHVYWLREGRITKVRLYLDPAEAREAVGVKTTSPT